MDMMQRLSQAGVSDAVRQWRNEAGHLRTAASAAHLRPPQKATLLREADAADRQADWWSDCLAQEFSTAAG